MEVNVPMRQCDRCAGISEMDKPAYLYAITKTPINEAAEELTGVEPEEVKLEVDLKCSVAIDKTIAARVKKKMTRKSKNSDEA